MTNDWKNIKCSYKYVTSVRDASSSSKAPALVMLSAKDRPAVRLPKSSSGLFFFGGASTENNNATVCCCLLRALITVSLLNSSDSRFCEMEWVGWMCVEDRGGARFWRKTSASTSLTSWNSGTCSSQMFDVDRSRLDASTKLSPSFALDASEI